jgi:hypothetical protein
MIMFRPTAKFAKTAKLSLQRGDVPSSSSALGDWFVTIVRAGGPHYIIANDSHNFAARFPTELAHLLAALGVSAQKIDQECSHYRGAVSYAPTNDRSTLGVLVDFCRLLTWELVAGVPLTYVSQRLACTPIVARKLFPGRATCDLFGAPPPADVVPWEWLAGGAV